MRGSVRLRVVICWLVRSTLGLGELNENVLFPPSAQIALARRARAFRQSNKHWKVSVHADMSSIMTPQTHPNHPTVGLRFRAWSIKNNKRAVYFCDSFDPAIGFWMTNEQDSTDRTCVCACDWPDIPSSSVDETQNGYRDVGRNTRTWNERNVARTSPTVTVHG